MHLIATLLLLFNPDAIMQRGVYLSKEHKYEASEVVLKTIKAREVSNPDVYNFYRLLNNFQQNNRKEIEQYLFYLDNERDLPVRYKVLTFLMQEDYKNWKKDDLGDVARDMNQVRDRLESANAGKKTQQIQKDIVRRLDKMIEEMEDQAKKQQEQQSKSQSKQGQQAKNQPEQPLPDSKIANESGTGEVDHAKFKKLQEKWGSLPPAEQARAMQELTQGMSRVHREGIENYFRNLAAAQSKSRR